MESSRVDGDSFEVSLWLFPAGQPPVYVPEYQTESSTTFIEDCGMMARSASKKRVRSRRSNKRLPRSGRRIALLKECGDLTGRQCYKHCTPNGVRTGVRS